jgi:hypothetical protein
MTPFDEGEELRPSDLARLEFRGPALSQGSQAAVVPKRERRRS